MNALAKALVYAIQHIDARPSTDGDSDVAVLESKVQHCIVIAVTTDDDRHRGLMHALTATTAKLAAIF